MANIERFYTKFHPTNYQIKLAISRETKEIKGTTTITGEALSSQIDIHQKDLQIEELRVDGTAGDFTIDQAAEAIHVKLPHTGTVTLEIKYTTKLTDTMMGIYPSYYEVNGETKQLVGTQFETTFARQAFPCVDEPEAKATFDLAIKFDEHPGEVVLSNMPETKVEDGYHYFARTVKMSTYLIAFAFGDLQSKQTKTKSGVQVGVFATKAHQPQELDFALDIAKRAIEFYEDFYQTPYPLPHSWQLALPDFSAGAMENWGLVTYREAYLLLDPKNTTLRTKQVVATVIAHELAHQWFGDLVTMQWWDDLWLNESFANMMEYVAVDALEPDWQIWELFQNSEAGAALQRDATDGVQSVHVQVNDPAEIDALFDGAIVYAKGARMLVMVRALIGDDALRQGLQKYFASHQYGNATGNDLWQALGEAANMPIGDIMHTWLDQPGYPVVTAQVENGDLVLEQQQFFIGEGQAQQRQWQIPLNGNYAEVPALLQTKTLNLGNYQDLRDRNQQPFRLNVGNSSHFIVRYDQRLLDDILADWEQLSAIDQLQLLQDLRLLAEGKQISYAEIVPLLPRFAKTDSALVTEMLYRVANDLKKFVAPQSSAEKQLKKFFGELSQAPAQRLGWQAAAGEANDDQLMRPMVLKAALYAENPAVTAQAHQLFEENEAQLPKLPAAIRSLVIRNEVEHFGSPELFARLLKEYQRTNDASYKSDLCQALTATPSLPLIQQLVQQFENAQVIKPQDLRAWFRGVLANPQGQGPAWNWIRDEWQWLEDTVGGDMEFATYITVIAGIFQTPTRLAEFKAFFEPKLATPGLTREITMDIKVIETRVALIETERDAVQAAVAQAIK